VAGEVEDSPTLRESTSEVVDRFNAGGGSRVVKDSPMSSESTSEVGPGWSNSATSMDSTPEVAGMVEDSPTSNKSTSEVGQGWSNGVTLTDLTPEVVGWSRIA
jgi:hypothetical protein